MTRILVADDEVDIRNIVESFLAHKGYEVLTASNGDEALEKVKSEKPDLVILDLVMPGKSGFEVCKTLRENAETSRIPIIVASVLARDEDRKKALEAGADAYLTKPFNLEVTAAIIEDTLRRS